MHTFAEWIKKISSIYCLKTDKPDSDTNKLPRKEWKNIHPINSNPKGAGMAILLLLLLSHFSRVRLCATPQTSAHQAPLSLGFSRQEHWSVLPFPSPVRESEK